MMPPALAAYLRGMSAFAILAAILWGAETLMRAGGFGDTAVNWTMATMLGLAACLLMPLVPNASPWQSTWLVVILAVLYTRFAAEVLDPLLEPGLSLVLSSIIGLVAAVLHYVAVWRRGRSRQEHADDDAER